jgi:hypothetical protein
MLFLFHTKGMVIFKHVKCHVLVLDQIKTLTLFCFSFLILFIVNFVHKNTSIPHLIQNTHAISGKQLPFTPLMHVKSFVDIVVWLNLLMETSTLFW